MKGIAYAGALQSLPDDIRVHGIGGTSAGAIVAALLAVGKRGKQLEDILGSPELADLLAKEEAARYAKLRNLLKDIDKWKTALAELIAILEPHKQSGWASFPQKLYKLRQFQDKYAQVIGDAMSFFRDAAACWDAKGAHGTGKIRIWLNKNLGQTTFKDLDEQGIDLRIVAADVGGRRFVIFNSEEYGAESVARAVHASLSIPVFFEPLQANDGECFVDGGVLSNFPSFLFNNSPYPTVGFRLKEYPRTEVSPKTTLGYLTALFETMASAHDKWRERLQHFKPYDIITPDYIPFDKFALTPQDINELYLRGKTVGQTVRWYDDDHSSEDKLIGYFDPNPNRVLHVALQEAERLAEEHLSPVAFVDHIQQDAALKVRIGKDWTTHYDRWDKFILTGPKSLLLQRIRVRIQPKIGKHLSLADCRPVCEEVSNGTKKPLAFIPAFNREDLKGFVFFFSPPIDATRPREIHSTLIFKGEFSETVGRGNADEILFSVTRRAKQHNLTIRISLLIHHGIRELHVEPNFKASYGATIVKEQGETYHEHRWELPEQELGTIGFPLKVTIR